MSHRAGAVVLELMKDAFPDWNRRTGRPKSLSLAEAVRLTLVRLRRNQTFAELGEDFGLAGSTAWEYYQQITGRLARVPAVDVDDLTESVCGKICLVDGMLVTVFTWRHRSDLFSGKHRRYGLVVQVIADLHGRVLGVSRGFPGSWHDLHAFTEARLGLVAGAAGAALGDAGYQGSDLITPTKKKPGQDRPESDIAYNTALAVLRAAVEWANAHLKNWRILATRYRDSLHRFDQTITAVAGLTMLNEQYSGRPLTFTRLNKLKDVSDSSSLTSSASSTSPAGSSSVPGSGTASSCRVPGKGTT
jgi:transposase